MIGTGGFGSVNIAEHIATGKSRAIKVIKKSTMKKI